MKTFKDFKKVELLHVETVKLVGGNGGGNVNEDVPVTNLGTVTNNGEG